ncbi:SsgA family sporulation/cell division regulator [Streptomyces gilvus]|uniref:SsgA family sporulation/cell division regulator n=1 Tax=Streptomyces gilvus TaxID=2920937 RepID=UPI001F0F0C8F|nr:SsgA family sporulation/cell division regulator [Streptomyces sp. CME 23]MCH5676843.1 SsgA family sporulation/cell division regulator [Streptomyces sp. CME 23]
MSQNSTGPRDEAVGHPSQDQHKLIPQSREGTDTPGEPVVISSDPVPWRLVLADERTVLFPGSLCYKSADPYAVHITFRVDDDTVDWVFARTLLIGGLLEPVGAGDVEIGPCSHGGVDTVQIALKADHVYVALEAPARVIAVFLKRTCQAVPLGTEHRHLDLDRLVSRLVQDVG